MKQIDMWPGPTKKDDNLSDCVTLWAHSFKMLKDVYLKFHRLLYYAAGLGMQIALL